MSMNKTEPGDLERGTARVERKWGEKRGEKKELDHKETSIRKTGRSNLSFASNPGRGEKIRGSVEPKKNVGD